MAAGWTIHRALCCVSPELEPERCAFEAANARFAERVTMPEGVLFGVVSPRSDFDPQINRRQVESNIRFCEFFVQVFGETAPNPAFFQFVDLAVACAADPAIPLRSAVVVFRNPERATAEMAGFRHKLANDPHCTVHDFHDDAEFDAVAETILNGWHAKIQKPVTAPASAG
jgi:hypothetical protein